MKFLSGAGSAVLPASMSLPKPKVLVITGPTAVGKTQISLKLAKELGGEIISADSIQVYRGLDIGSDKIPVEEREGIPHHLIDILEPTQDFSAGNFYERAREATEDILKRGRVPIVVGGTGFYLNFFIRGKPETPVSTKESEEAAWAHLRGLWSAAEAAAGAPLSDAARWDIGTEAVRSLGDPATADRLKQPEFRNNILRLHRAVDILLQSGGKPLADFIRVDWTPSSPAPAAASASEAPEPETKRARVEESAAASTSAASGAAQRTYRAELYKKDAGGLDYDFRCFYLCRERQSLYRRIDQRNEEMVARGLLGECAAMYDAGIRAKSHCASNGIGYRQGLEFVHAARVSDGATVTESAIKRLVMDIQSNTRTLTRRQNTWFRGDPMFRWVKIESGSEAAFEEILQGYRSEAAPEGGNGREHELSGEEKKEMKRYVAEWRVLTDKAAFAKVVAEVRAAVMGPGGAKEPGPDPLQLAAGHRE